MGGQPEFAHPEYQVGERETALEDALTPVYPTTEGMGQSTLRNLARQALTYLAQNPPDDLLQGRLKSAPSFAEAIALLHQPPAGVNPQTILEGRHPAQIRLASEELIAHQISMLSRRARTLQLQSAQAAEGGKMARAIIETLPFTNRRANAGLLRNCRGPKKAHTDATATSGRRWFRQNVGSSH